MVVKFTRPGEIAKKKSLEHATIVSFQILSDSLFPSHPNIGRHIGRDTDTVVKSTTKLNQTTF
jgi:hypothetical protein